MNARDASLETLVRLCGERAWRLARVMLLNDADADDAVQQAFVAAATKYERIPKDDAWPWFAKVVSLEARYLRRKRARREEPAMQQTSDASPDQQLERAELARLVHEALDQLPDGEREALALTH